MDESMKQAAAENAEELVAWVKGLATEGEEFVREQAPLLAQEIIAWRFWENAVQAAAWLVLMVAMICIATIMFRLMAKLLRAEEGCEDDADKFVVFTIVFAVTAILAICSGFGLMDDGREAIKAAVAPRVVLLEELRRLAG